MPGYMEAIHVYVKTLVDGHTGVMLNLEPCEGEEGLMGEVVYCLVRSNNGLHVANVHALVWHDPNLRGIA